MCIISGDVLLPTERELGDTTDLHLQVNWGGLRTSLVNWAYFAPAETESGKVLNESGWGFNKDGYTVVSLAPGGVVEVIA